MRKWKNRLPSLVPSEPPGRLICASPRQDSWLSALPVEVAPALARCATDVNDTPAEMPSSASIVRACFCMPSAWNSTALSRVAISGSSCDRRSLSIAPLSWVFAASSASMRVSMSGVAAVAALDS